MCVMNCLLEIPNSRSVLTGELTLVLLRRLPADSRLGCNVYFAAFNVHILISYNVMYVTSDVGRCGTLWPLDAVLTVPWNL